MKRVFFAIIILVAAVLFAGCSHGGNTIYDDDYHPGEDMQYFYTTAMNSTAHIQEIDRGCVFYHKGFMYVYDSESESIQPLCSKANCMHEKETDQEKLSECNACLSGLMTDLFDTLAVMVYKEDVYVYYMSSIPETVSRVICRISLDGSSKDYIYECNGHGVVQHRGYIYLKVNDYTFDKEKNSIKNQFKVIRLDIRSRSIKEEDVFIPEENVTGGGVFTAYGNYVYFSLMYEGEKGCIYAYDTRNHSIREIEELEYDNTYLTPSWNGKKLVYKDYQSDQDSLYETQLIGIRPDGTDRTVELERIPQVYNVVYDTKYLYVNNAKVLINPEIKRFWVYDENMELVDEFTLPETDREVEDPPIGGEKYQYLVFDEEEGGEWGLYIWDKSEIGTLHGRPYAQQKAVYEDRQ